MSSNNPANNCLHICNETLQNVIIMSDETGKNELGNLPKLKYNQHLVNRSINNLKNDSVLINDKVHSDCVVIVDEHGNNILESKDKISKLESNLFIEVLKQVQVDKEPANIEELLLKKRESLQNKLKTARYYFNVKSFVEACDLYKEALTNIETDVYPDEFLLKDTDILAIKFAYALSKMAICKSGELQSAVEMLTKLKTEHGDEFPTIYYYLARCLFLLEKYQDAKDVISSARTKLDKIEFLSELNWPGSDIKMIVRTEKPLLEENIQTLLNECTEFKLPDIKCIFLHCENKNIFFDSPCFNGYVTVKCSNKCYFNYHRNCWKKKLKFDCVKKPSYFLGNFCPTSDCGGIISEILIYDENLHLNTFLIPKVATSSDKNEENVTKKHKIISDIPNKNMFKKSGGKNEKKTPFNLYAKEYVPVNKNTLQLNTTVMEYIPHETNSVNSAENKGNLFDFIQNQPNTEPIVHINYSEEDKVSVDFKSNEDADPKLRAELLMMQSQLFQSEEDYNNLLAQNNLLQQQLREALKPPKKCDNCIKLENVASKKDKENSDTLMKLKQLEQNNNELTSKLKELQNAMNFELQERQVKDESNKNLIEKNEILQERVDDLLSKLKIMSQKHAYMVQHDNLNLRKVMFDQITCIRHAYASYFTLYENKSKHMLWELEDIKALSTAETLPTLADVEENILAWKNTLDTVVKSHYAMNGFYEHLFRQFSNEPTNNTYPIPMSFPSFIVEPPNIIVRHFKSLIIVNKRLEHELHQQINSFYKMMSTPYPGVFPQKNPSETTPFHIPPEKNSVLQNNTSENISEIVERNEITTAHNSKWDSINITNSKTSNMYDNLVATSSPMTSTSKKTKQSLFNDEMSSTKENYPTDAKFKSDSVGTIPKNKQSSFIDVSKHIPPMQNCTTKSKPGVIGPESLVNKLHEKLPLVPVDLISRAVSILRERSGGLTGKDSKQIIAEVKQILKEISTTEKCARKSKELSLEKPVKTWKKVNNGVHWNNEDPDVNCTICFEFMSPEKRIKLRCQHIFHKTCIKLWLQNDSICPICRSFATLDDEYPPLK